MIALNVPQLFHNVLQAQVSGGLMANKYNPPKVKLRLDAIKKNGKAAVYMHMIIARQKKPIPLNLDILPEDFNHETGFVKNDVQGASDMNLIISNELKKVTEIYTEYRLSGEILTLASFLREYNNWDMRHDFIAFMRGVREQRLADESIKRRTYDQHGYVIDKLVAFRNSISIADLNNDKFIPDFNRYLIGRGNNSSTRNKDLTNLKFYVNAIMKLRPRLKDPFNGFQMPQMLKRIVFLSKEELELLYKYYRSENISMEHKDALRAFLLMAFTSLRVGDALSLSKDCINGDLIVFIPDKNQKKRNGVPLSIPLTKIAREFIYEEGEFLIKPGDNRLTYFNKIYKEITKLLGIKKNITNHVARHTFGTQFILNGGQVTTLQLIMDHSDIEDTMIYVHVTAAHKSEGMKAAFEGFFEGVSILKNKPVFDENSREIKELRAEYQSYRNAVYALKNPDGYKNMFIKRYQTVVEKFRLKYRHLLNDEFEFIGD